MGDGATVGVDIINNGLFAIGVGVNPTMGDADVIGDFTQNAASCEDESLLR